MALATPGRGMIGDAPAIVAPQSVAEATVDAFFGRQLQQASRATRGWLGHAGGRPRGVNRRRQFSFLLVRGDGVRMLRFNFAKPVALGSCATLLVMASVSGAIMGDWVKLRRLTREAVAMKQQLENNRVAFMALNRRLADIRHEMASWRDLHARIQQPFGPDLIPGNQDRGIGGATTKDPRPAMSSPSEELTRLAQIVTEEGDNLRTLDRIMSRAGKAVAALPSRWPIRGSVNSNFGMRQNPWGENAEFHSGLDIRAQQGTPIRAPAAATVAFAGAQHEYGTTIILDHGQDVRSLYGHLSKIIVQPGQKIDRGTVIGYSGNTGRSSGPHLHYEVHVKGQAVNPRSYLWD